MRGFEGVYMNVGEVLANLKSIVGNDRATADDAEMIAYSRDQHYMFNEPRIPDFVVKPKNKEEIKEILKFANENKIPIVPLSQGVNIRGLCIPNQGGIILDMRLINKIKEIDLEMMTATIEPGVSVAQLVAACRKKGVRPAIPGSPATVSAFANYMLRGVYHSNPLDGMDHILSLEVMLPTGETFRTGSGAISTAYGPHCRYFGPDLTGLFMGLPGSFGVLTEMTVKLYDLPEKSRFLAYGFDTWEKATEFGIEVQKRITPNLMWLIDWLALTVITGFKRKDIMEQKPKAFLPHATVPVLIEGEEDLVDLKLKRLQKVIEKIHPDKELMGLDPDELGSGPMFSSEEFLGGRNVAGMLKMGYYFALAFMHPMKTGPQLFKIFKEVGAECGFDPDIVSFVSTPTASGPNNWSGQLTYSEGELFVDQTEVGMMDKLKKFSKLSIERIIDAKLIYSWFRPYAQVLKITLERAGETGKLLKKLKDIFDPNNIMNPGKFL
ncbi:MAG: FAD-binding oxidoreductase [Candidatus Helarchaeota archaeon]